MHFHLTAASATGNALSGHQAAETAMALRRARDLRESAAKIKTDTLDFSSITATDPETVSMISAWAGRGGDASGQTGQSGQVGQDTLPQGPSGNSELQADSAIMQPVRSTARAAPVSFWA